jgi:hypothetical protein
MITTNTIYFLSTQLFLFFYSARFVLLFIIYVAETMPCLAE